MIANQDLSLHFRGDGSCFTNYQHYEFLLCCSDGHLGLRVMGKKVNFFN